MEQKYCLNDIEFLISTQNRVSLNFLKTIFSYQDLSKVRILIINQTRKDCLLKSNQSNIRVVNAFETGVAKSRNLALENAKGEILVFTDDDVEYLPDTTNIIIDAYNRNNNPDVILFQAQKSSNKLLKKYPKNSQDPISIFTILNCGTIEVTLRNINSTTNKFRFDENFGINSYFGLGDEPLFLMGLKRKDKRIIFVNRTIVQHESDSTTTKNSLEKNYFGYGAFNKQMFGKYHLIWLLIKIAFDLKQKKIKLNQLSKVLNYAKQGRKKLDDLKRKEK